MNESSDLSDSRSPEDFGFQRNLTAKDTIFGKVRQMNSLSLVEIIFLIVSISSVIVTSGISIYKIVNYQGLNTTSDSSIIPTSEAFTSNDVDFSLAILVLVNSFFLVYFVIHGLFCERAYELAVYMASVLIIDIYLVVNFCTDDGWTQNYIIARLCAAAVLSIVILPITIALVRRYALVGRLIFFSVGARLDLQRACKIVFSTEALMKLDLQLQTSVLVIVVSNLTSSQLETILLSICFGGAVVLFVFGFFMIRYEVRLGVLIFLVLCLTLPAYIVYKIYLFSDNPPETTFLRLSFIFVLVGSFLCRVLMMFACVVCANHFYLGLKDKLAPPLCCVRSAAVGPEDRVEAEPV